ncbi:MAG: hypothetical protein LBS89_06725 [Zoogloeaceae bacterium]|jgi:hypothetical protein|nr:hypothetical protein [Zoogloeaceae bacterium]
MSFDATDFARGTLNNPVRPELVEGPSLSNQGQRLPQPERQEVVQSFPNDSVAARLLGQLLAQTRIAHQVPGRIRLKLTPASNDIALKSLGAAFSSVTQALGQIPGIRAIRPNLVARSCVVEYEARTIPDRAWVDLFQETSSPEAQSLRQCLLRGFSQIALKSAADFHSQ